MTAIHPLLVRSFGRTGTTVVMQLLGTSNNVLFERVYAFEHRLLAWSLRLAGLARRPAKNDESWHPDSVFVREPDRVGPPPYQQLTVVDRAAFSRELSRSVVQALLSSLDTQHVDATLPVYYAEKLPLDLAPVVNELVPTTRNILLLRDPRDEFLSVRSFNRKRGTLGFDWRPDDTDESYVRRLVHHRRPFLRAFAELPMETRRFKLRYEDLMRDGEGTAKALGTWLQLELSWRAVEASKASYQHHFTASSASSSVERWKTELEPALARIFQQELGAELESVGYDV